MLKEIDSLFFKFLWKKKITNKKAFEKIKRKILCLETKKGGLNMIRIQDQQNVFLTKWIIKCLDAQNSEDPEVTLSNSFFTELGGLKYACSANVDSHDFNNYPMIRSHFWQNALSVFLKTRKKVKQTDLNVTAKDPLFNNSKLRFKGKPLFISRWIKNGILRIEDMIVGKKFKTLEDMKVNVGNYGGLLFDHNAAMNSIRNSSFSLVINDNLNDVTKEKPIEYKYYPDEFKGSNS